MESLLYRIYRGIQLEEDLNLYDLEEIGCPFHRFIRKDYLLKGVGGNQCGLDPLHGLCEMEMWISPPSWRGCSRNLRGNRLIIAKDSRKILVSPEKIFSQGAEAVGRMLLEKWIKKTIGQID